MPTFSPGTEYKFVLFPKDRSQDLGVYLVLSDGGRVLGGKATECNWFNGLEYSPFTTIGGAKLEITNKSDEPGTYWMLSAIHP